MGLVSHVNWELWTTKIIHASTNMYYVPGNVYISDQNRLALALKKFTPSTKRDDSKHIYTHTHIYACYEENKQQVIIRN